MGQGIYNSSLSGKQWRRRDRQYEDDENAAIAAERKSRRRTTGLDEEDTVDGQREQTEWDERDETN